MKIGIHHRDKKGFFSERWIEFCKNNNIPYKVVNAYDSNIIEQLEDCDAFMWHHSNYDYRDALFANKLIFSLQQAGKKVFPNFNTTWHFDDKVGEMYLLQAIGAPLVPSYIFYTKEDALKWANETTFPKVFKLRGGSGSSNVKLVKNKRSAIKLIKKSFGSGFSQYDKISRLRDRYKSYKEGKDTFWGVCKSFARLFISTEYSKMYAKERGYAYFQEFIPNNKFDLRIVVVAGKAFAIKRMCREDDFRASGSGKLIYDKEQIDTRCVKISLETSKKLYTQSCAYDFVFDENNNPLIVEISYGFVSYAYDKCEGYWDEDMVWHKGEKFDFCGWMVEELISKK